MLCTKMYRDDASESEEIVHGENKSATRYGWSESMWRVRDKIIQLIKSFVYECEQLKSEIKISDITM